MNGLSTAEAAQRLSRVGPNALPEHAPDPLWRRFVRQFQSPLIYILLFALAFDLGLWIYEGAHAWPIEATAIGLIGVRGERAIVSRIGNSIPVDVVRIVAKGWSKAEHHQKPHAQPERAQDSRKGKGHDF